MIVIDNSRCLYQNKWSNV